MCKWPCCNPSFAGSKLSNFYINCRSRLRLSMKQRKCIAKTRLVGSVLNQWVDSHRCPNKNHSRTADDNEKKCHCLIAVSNVEAFLYFKTVTHLCFIVPSHIPDPRTNDNQKETCKEEDNRMRETHDGCLPNEEHVQLACSTISSQLFWCFSHTIVGRHYVRYEQCLLSSQNNGIESQDNCSIPQRWAGPMDIVK